MISLGNLAGIQDKIAESAWKPSTHLHCESGCDRKQKISKEDYANYLRKGWPKCCGSTMILYNQ